MVAREELHVGIRLIGPQEKLARYKKGDYYPFVRLLDSDLKEWVREKKLPYGADGLAPAADGWWHHVGKLLRHQIWLSAPKPIDCRKPEEELEPLYESIVAPYRPVKAQRSRLAGEISRCLNGLSKKFKARKKLKGFGGRDVEVLRAHEGRKGTVVVEGLNLATDKAEGRMPMPR